MCAYPVWKRIFDIVMALPGIVALFLFFPFVALAIVLESGLPVFVRLQRMSEGRIIKVFKFRTMVKNAQEIKQTLLPLNERKDGPLFKMKDDPRVTRIGKILRKLRLDEFPQFIDVLAGRLALVGPRPHEPEEVEEYPEEFKEVILSRGGLTGLSQVGGASALPFRKELELDLYYIKHQSLWLDIKILFKTVFIFLFDPTGV